MKGDPDFCLDICTHNITAQGERLEITETVKQQILDQITVFATDSFCTIFIAYSDLGNEMKEEYNDAANV